ncbi:MAG: DUF4870 domain-containing protein [Chloroflexi bacterium]|nr:DUF4870 domain-containing protein [Chloroflexota bacterium]
MYTGGSGTGLDPRVAGVLCYPLSVVTGVLFLVLEKHDRFVRFHAWQSILLFIAYLGVYTVVNVLGNILSILPFIGTALWALSRTISGLLGLVLVGVSVFLMVKAYQRERYKLPYLGDVAERNAYA